MYDYNAWSKAFSPLYSSPNLTEQISEHSPRGSMQSLGFTYRFIFFLYLFAKKSSILRYAWPDPDKTADVDQKLNSTRGKKMVQELSNLCHCTLWF